MRLTIKRIGKLRVRPGRYLDEHGLILQVFSPNSASWFLRYQRKGRERWLGLGPPHAFGLLEARERARRARALLADGIDPLEKKRAQTARSISFEACTRQYHLAHHRSWSSDKHRQQFLNSLRDHVFPRLGQQSVDAVIALSFADASAATSVAVPNPSPPGREKPRIQSCTRSRDQRGLGPSTTRYL